jgi:hypothetical protein
MKLEALRDSGDTVNLNATRVELLGTVLIASRGARYGASMNRRSASPSTVLGHKTIINDQVARRMMPTLSMSIREGWDARSNVDEMLGFEGHGTYKDKVGVSPLRDNRVCRRAQNRRGACVVNAGWTRFEVCDETTTGSISLSRGLHGLESSTGTLVGGQRIPQGNALVMYLRIQWNIHLSSFLLTTLLADRITRATRTPVRLATCDCAKTVVRAWTTGYRQGHHGPRADPCCGTSHQG